MAIIHPTALVDSGAQLADDVTIGAFAIVDAHVSVDAGTTVGAHTIITGHTRIGKNNRIFQFGSIGEISQDKKYAGEEEVSTTIGDNNTIREFVTIHAGTMQDRRDTLIGNNNWILAYSHIAHDCVVGNQCVFSNVVQLGGHVHVDDYVTLGGHCAVHQFCRIGAHVMARGGTMITRDVPPYFTVAEHIAKPAGINSIGLRRRGFSDETILAIRRAYKTLYRKGLTLAEARAQIAQDATSEPALKILSDFINQDGRGIVR